MPLLRIGPSVVLFVHVPKCGGSSVEDYLIARFGPLSFLDRQWGSLGRTARWSRSSPQHLQREAIDRIFAAGFVDRIFTVVRDPVARFLSAYTHARLHQRRARWLSPGRLLDKIAVADDSFHYVYDNHFRPMGTLIPATTTVFKLEDGGDGLIAWLDALAGSASGPRALPHSNATEEFAALMARRNRRRRIFQTALPPVLDPGLKRAIAEVYRDDFRRFGYPTGAEAPAVPQLTAPWRSADTAA